MNRGNDQIYLIGNLVDVEKVASDVPEFNYDGEKVVFYMQNPEDLGDYAIYVRGFLTVSAMKSSHRFLKRRIRDVKRLRKGTRTRVL